MDLWALLAMPGISTQRAKAVQALLKRKFAEGHATNAWLQGALLHHEEARPSRSIDGLMAQLSP